ncbi:MAG: alanine racemase [Alphaproteobacteria bacterium]|nr:alanine racemase [Alphaproteobacteria bacterium]
MTFLTPTLTVNLSAIVANWKLLAARFTGQETAAVVKADAYGLGMVPVSEALAKAGCHTFFVATLEEAITLRAALPDVRILVFHGVQHGEEFAFATHRLIPVLNSREQLARWKPVAKDHVHAVSALHIDTGMGRLGLQPEEFKTLDAQSLTDCRVSLIMSHLACAPDPNHPLNLKQLEILEHITASATGIPVSFANSGGVFLPESFHFHLARVGCSLYGIAPQDEGTNPMQQVAHWQAPIIQMRTISHEQSVGYGATKIVPKDTRIITVASGYADGYHRILSNHSCAYLGAHRLPLLGRVTMDMLCFDGTEVPESLLTEGAMVTLLGNHPELTVDAIANRAQTIGYEILTSIGPRVKRVYV